VGSRLSQLDRKSWLEPLVKYGYGFALSVYECLYPRSAGTAYLIIDIEILFGMAVFASLVGK
jgi:hypothetical protein